LTAAHYGRPFNLWRYGSKRIDAFRNDVEGRFEVGRPLLPHSAVDGARPTGRFGLGSGSVYLITDAPRIHSGDWHFEITAACIPKEIPIPDDYAKGLTKIVLPLTANGREEHDGERGRYANLLPFLRHIDLLRLEHSDGTMRLDLRVTPKTILSTAAGYVIDRVVIEGARHVGEARSSSFGHGIAAMEASWPFCWLLMTSPVAWSEAFDADVFAALPLRAKLACGVAVSNLFEVQSGRTHLIDPAANTMRVTEVAQALGAVIKALAAGDTSIPGQMMTRFWSVWR
jgi:hypothetical protein